MNRTLQQPCPVINTLPRSIDLYKQCRQAQSAHDEVTAWLQQCLSKEVVWQDYFASDYWLVLNFLYSYRGSPDTFRAYRRDIEAAADPQARRRELEDMLEEFRSPLRTAEAFGIEEIIDPRETRSILCNWISLAYEILPTQLGPKSRTPRP